jgi:hypothetical protein
MSKRVIDTVFEAVRGEIEYQDRLWGGECHTLAEWLLFMRDYLDEASRVVSRKAAPQCDEEALHIVRKITTMGVRCMEENGVYDRDMRDLERSCELHGVKCEGGEDA